METVSLLWSRPDQGQTVGRIVLAHGAGAPMDSAPMTALATGLAERGFEVARFEFPYMHGRREGSRRGPDREPILRKTWHQVIEQVGDPTGLVIGGKSMGGRMASLIADEAGVLGLVCFGYPFHPPGRPEKLRTAHLAALRTPTLILQGTRDPFGKPDEVAGYELAAGIRVVWIEDGDHSFKPRKKSGRTLEQNLTQAIDQTVSFSVAVR